MFSLHERLVADTLPVIDWPLCRVLLMNDSTYPWLILVPARANIREIHQLDAADRVRLMDEIVKASQVIEAEFQPAKINVAALGNMVPQLHVHVVGRNPGDPAWPRPVWGAVPAKPYGEAQGAEVVDRLKKALA